MSSLRVGGAASMTDGVVSLHDRETYACWSDCDILISQTFFLTLQLLHDQDDPEEYSLRIGLQESSYGMNYILPDLATTGKFPNSAPNETLYVLDGITVLNCERGKIPG